MLRFRVAPEFAGQRLDVFIRACIPRLSRTRAQEIVKTCAHRPDGTKRRPGERVLPGETVLLVRQRFVEPEVPTDFGILYEDEDLLVLDKPSGLPVHPTATYHRNTVTYQLKQRYGTPAPQIAHRLDRETSGVLLCAKNLASERKLKMCFEKRRVKKSYLAIVRGGPPKQAGEIQVPMRRAKDGPHFLMEVGDEGIDAASHTDYECRGKRGEYTLVELYPRSGRQHQLRVHLGWLGCPIVGDKMYGPEGTIPFFESLEDGVHGGLLARLGHYRQALHAHRLTIAHPTREGEVEFISPLPPDLQELWNGFLP